MNAYSPVVAQNTEDISKDTAMQLSIGECLILYFSAAYFLRRSPFRPGAAYCSPLVTLRVAGGWEYCFASGKTSRFNFTKATVQIWPMPGN